MCDFQKILESIKEKAENTSEKGKVPTYIPELAKVDKNHFGIYLNMLEGDDYCVGDWDIKFSIQSISKVLSLAMAFNCLGANKILKRMDVEPSGNPFNYLSLLELEEGIPRNPFINSGAIVIADILISELKSPKNDFLQFVRDLANDQSIDFNFEVAASEAKTGYTNFAAANLLKSFNNLENDVDEVLDFYFHQCSIEMNCKQLSNAFYLFANKGKCLNNKTYLTSSQVKRINAIMLTCGFYDEAGEFAFEVGLPGKSGVGGGIVALLPGTFIITCWSPGLNPKGNSKLGMLALESFTTQSNLSIF